MSLVRDVMTPEPATIGADATVAEAARLMKDRDVGALPVVYGEKLVALVTRHDLVERVVAGACHPDDPVLVVSSGEPVTVAPEDDVHHALRVMASARVRSLPVVADGDVVGMLGQADVASER